MRDTIWTTSTATATRGRRTDSLLRMKVEALRADITAAEQKRARIDHAITSRRQTLNRLLAQLALSAPGAAHAVDEQ